MLPGLGVFFDIIGMNKLQPSPIPRMFKRKASVFTPLRIEIINFAGWFRGKNLLRYGFGHKAQLISTLLYFLICNCLDSYLISDYSNSGNEIIGFPEGLVNKIEIHIFPNSVAFQFCQRFMAVVRNTRFI